MIDANEALQQILQTTRFPAVLFPPTSRYHGIETSILEGSQGDKHVYLKRRLLPLPERFELLREHLVTEGERLDNITAHYMIDPEQFWRICDANAAMRPGDLEEIGRRLRITLPDGMPGMPNA